MFDLGSERIEQSRRSFLQRCALGSVGLAAGGIARSEPAPSGAKRSAGDTYETHAVGIRIVPGAWRPHYAWEHIAWVSPPWPSQDYIWLDFPEAIFTSQGLLYLSHVNPPIPTVFHDLPRIAWREESDGITFERTLPNGVAFGGSVTRADESTVDLELRLVNGSKQDLANITLQTCAFLRAIKEFADCTQDNKHVHVPGAGWIPLADAAKREGGKEKYRVGWRTRGKPVADLPVAVAVSNSAERLVAMTWYDDTLSMVGNPRHPCFHADPHFPDLKPGEQATIRGKLIFFAGPLAEFDFGKYGR
ncbi:MAG: twin-arginine translocation signal domain-containing protein [Pirellulales bacterium]|nr:twin-arginine translocation signal domain-containing protein [Pirellulales bacterium]